MCAFLSSRITTFCKKCPKVTPKGSQKEAKSHPNGGCPTSQNIWFLQYGSPFWPFRLGFGSTCFLQCFSDTVFFRFLATFEASGAKKASKMDEDSRGKMPLKSTLSPKSSPGGPREAQELQNEAKVLPKGAKMEPQGPQN